MRKKEDHTESILDTMKAHFGNAAKTYWLYAEPFCPCCMVRPIDMMTYEGKEALSINCFMYREKSVLIAYFLCGPCATAIMALSKLGPHKSKKHQAIEENLVKAYHRYLSSLDA